MDETLSDPESEPASPSQEIADMLADYGESYGFDEETVREIASQSFEEAYETTYGYLSQAGLDAEVILAPWLERPDQRLPNE